MQDSEQRKVLVVQTLMDFCINKNTPRIVNVTFFHAVATPTHRNTSRI